MISPPPPGLRLSSWLLGSPIPPRLNPQPVVPRSCASYVPDYSGRLVLVCGLAFSYPVTGPLLLGSPVARSPVLPRTSWTPPVRRAASLNCNPEETTTTTLFSKIRKSTPISHQHLDSTATNGIRGVNIGSPGPIIDYPHKLKKAPKEPSPLPEGIFNADERSLSWVFRAARRLAPRAGRRPPRVMQDGT